MTDPAIDMGAYRIRCVHPNGVSLTGYGQYAFGQNQEIDLLDPELPDTIRCISWSTANTMCTDPGLELAQRISAGEFIVVENRRPDLRRMIR